MTKRIHESPTILDTILFELETSDGASSIERISIYCIERDFGKLNDQSYEITHQDPVVLEEINEAKRKLQDSPTADNLEFLRKAKIRLEALSLKNNLYFNEARAVFSQGNKNNPIGHLDKSKVFEFTWDASGNREGDYFITWSWRVDDALFNSHQMFRLEPHKKANTYIPVRYTPPDKYDVLLQRYLPEMYKYKITNKDLTPSVVSRLNKCVAKGFTFIEDLANQLMDIYDANTTHEAILPLLANFFNLRLRSTDVTLWRRQIKQVIGLYKSKGTLKGLTTALEQAGIKLSKFTNLWQVVSNYIWTDGFVVTDESEQKFIGGDVNVPVDISPVLGTLSKTPHDREIKKISIKSQGKLLTAPIGSIRLLDPIDEGNQLVIWEGGNLETPIYLYSGDVVLIQYYLKPVPENRRAIEEYIQHLPLADLRDETEQNYPLKNWNVHLIEEDDPLFNIIINERHPFHDPINFGKVRTTFLYSEKVYNMDTFDGSLRDSKAPCDIDKDFLDSCSYCQSSKFNVDLEIEDLSSDRIEEARSIIREYGPFDALLNAMNISGVVNDFIVAPVEDITRLVQLIKDDIITDKLPDAYSDMVKQEEQISFSIVYADGTKESGKI